MSKIAVSSPASGTATYTISAPAGSTDRTLTLPDNTGTILTTATAGVPVNGPAFSAVNTGGQFFSNGTATKIQFGTEEFDTAGAFDSTTNYRFQPLVAGYYQFTGGTGCSSSVNMFLCFFKNGSEFKRGQAASSAGQVLASALIYCNGSTDYVELYLYNFQGSTISNAGGASQNYFQAAMVRSAT
jgi:hypothetical protein